MYVNNEVAIFIEKQKHDDLAFVRCTSLSLACKDDNVGIVYSCPNSFLLE